MESVIPKGDDAMLQEVCNEYTIQKVPDTKLNRKWKHNKEENLR